VSYIKYDSENFIEKLDYSVTATHEKPLNDSISQIPSLATDLGKDGCDSFVCRGGNSKVKIKNTSCYSRYITA